MAIEVSVVCITYNQAPYVEKMLRSIINQKTNFEYEILIHDDASNDMTQMIIRKYANKYPKMVKPILQNENQFSKGINPNISYNYPRVQGKYIAYCEGDDYWNCPNKLQKQYDAMKNNESCALCVHDVQCVYQNGDLANTKFPPVHIESGVILAEDYIRLELKDAGWLFQTSSYFIRTDVINKFVSEYKSQYPVGDLALVLFSLQYGNCYYLNETMSCYRLDSGGYMSKLMSREKRIAHCKKMIEGHIDFDQRTKGVYHDYFSYAVLNKEVEILVLKKNYKEIFKRKYCAIRNNMNFRKKVLIGIGCIFPEIADLLERKKNGWTE